MSTDAWLEDALGRTMALTVERLMPRGAYLTPRAGRGDEQPVLLPRSELPEGLRVDDPLEAFLYLDSEDRPIATTRAPKLERGEVAFLPVSDVTRVGAFIDWGLPKELLVPFAEQTRELRPGDLEPIGLTLDRTGRLAGTMRIRELFARAGRFALDEWVEGEAWREEPELGVFVILERRFLGLLPASEPHALSRGEPASFRIAHLFGDGKIELSLRGRGHEELARDAAYVLQKLTGRGAPAISEQASPAQIRALFGLSKKAFKRAVGRLLKEGAVTLDARGTIVPR